MSVNGTNSIRSGIDWVTVSVYLALVFIGWLMVYSASVDTSETGSMISLEGLSGKHMIMLIISLFVFICALFIDWKFWDTFAYVFYALGIITLIGVLIFGLEIKGARSWYSILGFSFQPGETAKFFTALAVSSYLSSYKTNIDNLKSQLTAIGLFVFPAGLILLQPDAGSALVFFSFFILLFREGLSPIYYIIGLSAIGIFVFSLMASPSVVTFVLLGIGTIFLSLNFKNKALWSIIIGIAVLLSLIFVPSDEYLYMLIAGLAGLGLVLLLQWDRRKVSNYVVLGGVIGIATLFSFGSNFAFEKFLEPHQQDRINVWLRPQLCDPQGSLYNIIQSKLAIGSGGLQGKGFMNGDMTKLNYVPEQSSDFIFSIIGEEQGFLGVFSVIVLFLLLLYRIIIIGERAKNNFIRHYAYGIAGIVFVHYFINIGMTMGIMPVIGIPLPFLSQGGTALIAFSLMIGVLLKMDMSR